MSIARNIHIQAMPAPPRDEREVEMCEHKGIGHPDTLTDGACEAAAQALAQAYMRARGRVLHFNVDKGLLIAGQSAPCFGGGKIVEPIKLIVCGRAAPCPDAFDVGEVVVQAVRDFLRRTVNVAPAVFEIVPAVKAGSASLATVYSGSHAVALANDTSFGVGFVPYSPLEQDVLHLAEILRSAEGRAGQPRQRPHRAESVHVAGSRGREESRGARRQAV
jgi:S-adenosylmethionine synthetase